LLFTMEELGEAIIDHVVGDEELLLVEVGDEREEVGVGEATKAPRLRMCSEKSSRPTPFMSLNRFTTTAGPSHSVALYEDPKLPLPNTSAEARSRSSISNRTRPSWMNTSRPCSSRRGRFPTSAALVLAVAPGWPTLLAFSILTAGTVCSFGLEGIWSPLPIHSAGTRLETRRLPRTPMMIPAMQRSTPRMIAMAMIMRVDIPERGDPAASHSTSSSFPQRRLFPACMQVVRLIKNVLWIYIRHPNAQCDIYIC
jgi:hypothetical protein